MLLLLLAILQSVVFFEGALFSLCVSVKMGKKSLNTSEAAEALDASQVESGPTYEDKLKFVNRIAKPMASKKLAKKLLKMIKKGIFIAIYSCGRFFNKWQVAMLS